MIDIHSHILPKLDDGPDTLFDSVAFAQQAMAEGISTIIATPHAMNGVYHCPPEDIIDQCSLLTRELDYHNIPVKIRPGAEIRLTHDTVARFDRKELMTLNNLGRHLLLELPPLFMFDGVLHIISQLAERDVTTIIAHPERNQTLTKKPTFIAELIYEGAQMQITALSLMGGFGKRTMQLSEKMIESDQVSYVSSDFHPGRRFKMHEAYQKVSAMIGEEGADEIFNKNPGEIMYFTPQAMNYAK